MADLIDRQAARKKLLGESVAKYPCSFVMGLAAAADEINKLPAVDAVEVVRCKDCVWFNASGCAIRIVDESDKPKETDFCSFGERRGEDAAD